MKCKLKSWIRGTATDCTTAGPEVMLGRLRMRPTVGSTINPGWHRRNKVPLWPRPDQVWREREATARTMWTRFVYITYSDESDIVVGFRPQANR